MNMLKQIQLKISKIKYTGDSIGDDIRIEIEALDKFLGSNKELKRGNERALNEIVGTFFADGVSFALPVNIKIIERDLIFNDAGSKKVNLKVDLKNESPQNIVCKIEVLELRNFFSKKKAVFEVTMEVLVSDAILYISDKTGGWIRGIRNDTKEEIALVPYLKVQLERDDLKRRYFTIMEGVLRDVKASVKIEEDGTSYLDKDNPHTEPVSISYSISKKTVKFRNRVYTTIDYPSSPWEKGFYDIEIPDHSHGGGLNYPESKLATIWFRIGHGGTRYFHPGSYSLGCMTLTQINRWDELCKILLKARKDDGRSIGTLEVVD